MSRRTDPSLLISDLMKLLVERCCVCKCPATRRLQLSLLVGNPPIFCDRHTNKDVSRLASLSGAFQDLDCADLVRRCNEYFETTEVKC